MSTYKISKKGIVIFSLIAIILLGTILVFAFSTGQSKTPVTSQQVYEKLTSLGYEPTDTTSLYIQDDPHLVKSITLETNEIRFDFFEFDNNNGPSDVYNNALVQMLDYRKSETKEGTAGYSNYSMYYIINPDKYYTVVKVENTAFYAYCDEDYRKDLFKIINAIGYEN